MNMDDSYISNSSAGGEGIRQGITAQDVVINQAATTTQYKS